MYLKNTGTFTIISLKLMNFQRLLNHRLKKYVLREGCISLACVHSEVFNGFG